MIWDKNQHMWMANDGHLSFIGWNIISRRVFGTSHLIVKVVRKGIIRTVISKVEYVPIYDFRREQRKWI